MRNLLFLIITIIIYACGGNPSKEGMKETKLTAEIGSENYEVDVRYHLDENNGLTVYSDKTDVADSNNDGLIFAIFEYNGKLQFDFVKDGQRLGGQITDWEKTESDIFGNGTLKEESGLGQGISVSFNLQL
nr:hypothetical protein [uncultured Allomuricauda sp.]